MSVNIIIIAAVVATAVLLWSPRFHRSITWRAMTTPLASIIGSGFLVLGPILDAAYGWYAPLVMAGLCLSAYAYGAAIRFNIRVSEQRDVRPSGLEERLETAASWSLAFAYVISVAYYLNLFGAFGVSLTAVNDAFHAKLLTSAVFVFILFVGWTQGFRMLEQLEYASVTTKLAIIAGLLVGLAVYFSGKVFDGGLYLNVPQMTGWPALTLAFGLIVTVQGFETSRYLGAEYDSETRIRSMKMAQWVTTGIYMIYIGLFAFVFARGEVELVETAIVDMMGAVAPILPALLVAAALAAQFSAAVADTSGSGGLFSEVMAKRLSPRQAYLGLTGIGLLLTWSANIFEIISYASRAFAVYYMLQALIAALVSFRLPGGRRRSLLFAAMAVLGALIVLFGQAVEGQPG